MTKDIKNCQEPEIEHSDTNVSDQSFPDAESFINSLLEGLNKDNTRESSNPSPPARESNFTIPQSPKVILMHSIDSIYNALRSKRLSVRKAGLEMLSINTIIEGTLSSTSVPCAVIVLTGKKPISQDEYVDKCFFIHSNDEHSNEQRCYSPIMNEIDHLLERAKKTGNSSSLVYFFQTVLVDANNMLTSTTVVENAFLDLEGRIQELYGALHSGRFDRFEEITVLLEAIAIRLEAEMSNAAAEHNVLQVIIFKKLIELIASVRSKWKFN